MNVLCVTYDFPFPTNSGGKNRAFHLLKHNASRSNISLFSFVRDEYDPSYNNQIYDLGVKDIKVFKRKKVFLFSNLSKTLINNSSIFRTLYFDKHFELEFFEYIKAKKIDVVHFESTYTGYYIGEKLKKMGVRTILGTENIEFELYYDYAKFTNKFFLKPFIKYQAGRLKQEELFMVKNADVVTTITKSEADLLEKLTGKKCVIVANGIEPDEFSYSYDTKIKKNILFVGNFNYFPNVDGIQFFRNEVFDGLDKDITLTVIGKNITKILKDNNSRIIKKEFVEDIISEYRAADIMIFPIRIGGGTNFKVLEAMALGVPIVAYPDRLAGLNALENVHFLPAKTGAEYKDKISMFYADSVLRERVSKEARSLIDRHFSWSNISDNLYQAWKG